MTPIATPASQNRLRAKLKGQEVLQLSQDRVAVLLDRLALVLVFLAWLQIGRYRLQVSVGLQPLHGQL